ncbi:MAG: class I SAM-dependent methyltransferase [Bacteroidota bacterium]
MRHFEGYNQALRYHSYRPQVHKHVVQHIRSYLDLNQKVGRALDIGCGTGHSTAPLRQIADHVMGLDASAGMVQVGKEYFPDIDFRIATAEKTGLADNTIDLFTTSMAFHWFDQQQFLKEVYRVARKPAFLCVYFLWFPGEMSGNSAFQQWYQGPYLQKFPTPSRHSNKLFQLLEVNKLPIVYLGRRKLDFDLSLSLEDVKGYLSTQSNITSALKKGESLSKVNTWLGLQLKPFFSKQVETFSYRGLCEFARLDP